MDRRVCPWIGDFVLYSRLKGQSKVPLYSSATVVIYQTHVTALPTVKDGL